MKYISFGYIDKKFLIPVFGGIICLLFEFFIQYNPKIGKMGENPFIRSIYITIGMILAFIPLLIVKQKSKAANKIYNEQILQSELYNKLKDSNDVIKKTKCKKFRFIFYITIFDFIDTLLFNLFMINFVYNFWIFDITFMSLFSFIILKTKYYKHQFISMIAIVALGIGLNIIGYFKFDKTGEQLKFLNIFIKFISEICFSLMAVLVKYTLFY